MRILHPGVHGARCAWAMAVHHAVGISRQRNSGYRPSRVNIVAQGLSTPDPSLSPTHLSIRRGRTTTTHYTHHQVRHGGVVQHYTSPFPGVAHLASLWGRPQRWHAKGACVTPNKKEKKKRSPLGQWAKFQIFRVLELQSHIFAAPINVKFGMVSGPMVCYPVPNFIYRWGNFGKFTKSHVVRHVIPRGQKSIFRPLKKQNTGMLLCGQSY